MTVKELAQLLEVSRAAIYEGIKRNEIPFRRIGRRIVIPTVLAREWLEGDAVTREPGDA
jgi:excisionase family DNA binding protein